MNWPGTFQREYPPIDVSKVYERPTRAPAKNLTDTQHKFDGITSNMVHYQKWNVSPRPRYIDFHEGHTYVPPVDKFTATSTTQATFVPKSAPIPDAFRPDDKAIDKTGAQDFRTINRLTYTQPGVTQGLTRQQKKRLFKELLKRKGKENPLDMMEGYQMKGTAIATH